MLHVIPSHCSDFTLAAVPEPPRGPRFHLIQQSSSVVEKVSKNGIQKNVHVVVKNMPFVIQVGLSGKIQHGSLTYDFKNLALDLQLLYDNEALKPVGFVRTRPCDFKTSVSERGDSVTLTTRIKVLTSQHEDMFFLVRVRGLDPKGKKDFNPPLDLISNPIKVISKPKQLKKRKTQKKRSLNDLLIESVTRIEERQNAQRIALEQILLNNAYPTLADANGAPKKRARHMPMLPSPQPQSLVDLDQDENEDGEESEGGEATRGGEVSVPPAYDVNNPLQFMSSSTPLWPPGIPDPGIRAPVQNNTTNNNNNSNDNNNNNNAQAAATPQPSPLLNDPFTMAMAQFLLSYQHIPIEERPTTIRRIIRDCSSRETEQLSELFELILALLARRFTWQNQEKKKLEASFPQPAVDMYIVKMEPPDKDKEAGVEGGGEGGDVHRPRQADLFGAGLGDPTYLIGGEEIVCNCPECPHKKELETIDQFYREFVTSEIPLEGMGDPALC